MSLSGNDSTGVVNDITKPYRTPNYVRTLSAFGPGDFIIVRGGVYNLNDGTNNLYSSRWLIGTKSGTAGNPMSFMGYPGEAVEAHATVNLTYLFASSTSVETMYWVVANFRFYIDHTGGTVIMLGATAKSCDSPTVYFRHGRVVNIDISGGVSAGTSGSNVIIIATAEDVKLFGSKVHDTGVSANGQNHSHPFYLSAQQNNIEVGWNQLYNIPSSRAVIQVHMDGFTGCYGVKSMTDISIHDNVIHNVNGESILIGGGTGDITIYNNIMYNSDVDRADNFSTLALRGDGGTLNASVYNNTTYSNPYLSNAWGLIEIGSVTDSYCPQNVTFYNNNFILSATNDPYLSIHAACIGMNIYTSDYNNWYGSTAHSKPSFEGTHGKSVDPEFVDPVVMDFRLQPSSLAIDAGTGVPVPKDIDGNIRPFGSAIDIGAYEYCGADCVSVDSTSPARPINLMAR